MFKKIYIEITNICNLKCKFCPETSRKKELMSIENFEKIISKICKHTKLVCLHVKGEPLLHNQLEDILSILEKYDLRANITTNGTLIKDKLEVLKKCILVRDVVDYGKFLTYKYKKYAKNGDILEQGKIECKINNIEDAVKFMEAINYKILFKIYDKCIVYANETTELAVQLVNDKYIFIELEDRCNHINRFYNKIDESEK